ncbi:MAG: glycosyltransferase family 4 protein [Flavobacteriales bacterium]|nr:glycosyltransferase family 4 protein [Flavobacteriales bacterium]
MLLKKIVSIFPIAENVHLIKDVGQIGNSIGRLEGYEATFVCYNNSESYSFLTSEVINLKISFLKKEGKKLFMEKAVLRYLESNAKKITIVHFQQLTKETIYYSLHYLKYNPNGKVYVKMDVNNESLEKGIRYSKKSIFNWYHKRKEKQFLAKIAAISTENPTSLKLLKKRYPSLGNKALLITNGVNDQYLEKHFPTPIAFNQKDNIILSVGRIGASDKNFEMLLEAFGKANIKDWKLVFVGPIENEFDKRVERIIVKYPNLKNQIELVGNVEDREELYEYYNRSKICCLTSPFESFGITFIEAMYFGNYVIGTTGMSSFSYITNKFELGKAIDVNDENALIDLLEKVSNDEVLLAENYQKAKKRIADKFYWSKIVTPLIKKLSD